MDQFDQPRSGAGDNHLHISRASLSGDRAGEGPTETRVHLSRTGSVDIFAISPQRGSAHCDDASAPEHREREPPLFEATLDTPDRRYLRVSTDARLRDSTATGVKEYSGAPRQQVSSVTASSKAVLSALRALQDKIKRVEQERNAALEEAARLRREKGDLEQLGDSQRSREAIDLQDRNHAARLAYERLLADKSATDVKLHKSEEERRELVAEVNGLRGKLEAEEAARRQAEERLRQVDQAWAPGIRRGGRGAEALSEENGGARGLGGPGSHAPRSSTGSLLGAAGLGRVGSGDGEVMGALQLELLAERRQRLEAEERQGKVGELLLAVMSMNEHLVQHMSPSPRRAKKKTATKAGGTVGARTPLSRASSTRGASQASQAQLGVGVGGGLHTAARAKARRKVGTGVATGGKLKTPTRAGPLKPKKPGVTGAHLMLQLPFLPAPHRRTFNLLASLSEAVRQCRVKEPKQVLDALYELMVSSDYAPDKTPTRQAFDVRDSSGGHDAGTHSLPFNARSGPRPARRAEGIEAQHILGDTRPSMAWSPPRGQTMPYSPTQHTEGDEEFERLYQMLEEELHALKQRYHEVVRLAREAGDGSNLDPVELEEVLLQIQRKEQEVRLLRNARRRYGRPASRTRSPLRSPEATRRTVDRLSVLSGIKGLTELHV